MDVFRTLPLVLCRKVVNSNVLYSFVFWKVCPLWSVLPVQMDGLLTVMWSMGIVLVQ